MSSVSPELTANHSVLGFKFIECFEPIRQVARLEEFAILLDFSQPRSESLHSFLVENGITVMTIRKRCPNRSGLRQRNRSVWSLRTQLR